ncbi:hypothetical protein D3C81_1974350 [compost metagenome]
MVNNDASTWHGLYRFTYYGADYSGDRDVYTPAYAAVVLVQRCDWCRRGNLPGAGNEAAWCNFCDFNCAYLAAGIRAVVGFPWLDGAGKGSV